MPRTTDSPAAVALARLSAAEKASAAKAAELEAARQRAADLAADLAALEQEEGDSIRATAEDAARTGKLRSTLKAAAAKLVPGRSLRVAQAAAVAAGTAVEVAECEAADAAEAVDRARAEVGIGEVVRLRGSDAHVHLRAAAAALREADTLAAGIVRRYPDLAGRLPDLVLDPSDLQALEEAVRNSAYGRGTGASERSASIYSEHGIGV